MRTVYGSNKIIPEVNEFCKMIQQINYLSHYLENEKKDFDLNRSDTRLATFEELYEEDIKTLEENHKEFLLLFQSVQGIVKSVSMGIYWKGDNDD
jgi:flagellar motility protein MotE (MotC chaperone)